LKKVSILSTVVLILLSALVTFQITYLSLDSKYDSKLSELEIEMSEFKKLFEIKDLVDDKYVHDIDTEKLIDTLASAYLAGIGDKYARYYAPDDTELVDEIYRGKIVGIGVSISTNDTESHIEILGVYDDSPALEAGLKAGDLIIAVDGKTVAEMGYSNAVASVKGEEGTTVVLRIRRGSEELDVNVVRREITEVTVSSKMLSDGITGYIRITSFNGDTPGQFKAAVTELRTANASRFVFDLRYNGGGELSSIVNILDYLLPEGPIVRVVDKDGTEAVKNSDASCIEEPMAVLVNGRTASAAELFTIALRDYKKAVVVGTKTYGKGTVQTLYELSDGSIVSLSSSMYCGPYSDNYEGVGISPDIEIAMTEEELSYSFSKLPENKDGQLKEALKAFADFDTYFNAE